MTAMEQFMKEQNNLTEKPQHLDCSAILMTNHNYSNLKSRENARMSPLFLD
jgi:hypothetical protein